MFFATFVDGYYRDDEGLYYDIDLIPTLLPYDSEKVSDSLSFALESEYYPIYLSDGGVSSEIETLGDFEFITYQGDNGMVLEDCNYYIETENGTIYIYSDSMFLFMCDSFYEPRCYELIKGSFLTKQKDARWKASCVLYYSIIQEENQ